MSQSVDFRDQPQFNVKDISKSGLNIGKTVYWKLYAVENFYRIIIHSILSVQIGLDWWRIATDINIQNRAKGFKRRYERRPWYSLPGHHLIYYTDLCDLNEITRVHAHFFASVIPDIDQWILKIEDLRLPRNVVAHMNFPGKTDRQRIGLIYNDFKALIGSIQTQPALVLQIPK